MVTGLARVDDELAPALDNLDERVLRPLGEMSGEDGDGPLAKEAAQVLTHMASWTELDQPAWLDDSEAWESFTVAAAVTVKERL